MIDYINQAIDLEPKLFTIGVLIFMVITLVVVHRISGSLILGVIAMEIPNLLNITIYLTTPYTGEWLRPYFSPWVSAILVIIPIVGVIYYRHGWWIEA